MFQLIKEDELVPFNKALVCVLFGEPGMGKTSLSFTSRAPLLMDFDDGVRRAVHRKTAAKFDTWADVLALLDSDTIAKEGIKTLIVDTAGTMLDDYLAQHVIKMDPKYGNGAGGLGLKGYGIMKDAFSNFLTRGAKMGVEAFVFIAHTKEQDDGDATRLKPKLTGGSYDTLVSKADLVGYLEMKNGVATLDFNPTTRHIGKNCAEFKAMSVPPYASPDYANFLTRLLDATRDRMTKQSEAQIAAVAQVNSFKDTIAAVESTDELEAMAPEIEKLAQVYRIQVATIWNQRFAELWTVQFLDAEKVKTPDDFATLAEVIKELPYPVQAELRGKVKEFADAQGVRYDAAGKRWELIPKDAKNLPSEPQNFPKETPALPAADPKPAAGKKKPAAAAATMGTSPAELFKS